MVAPRTRSTVHTQCGVLPALAAALLLSSCGGTAQFLASLRELRVVQQKVAGVAGTGDVSVNLRKDHVLRITVRNLDVSGKPAAERQEFFRRIAAAAFLAFPSRSALEAVVVEDVASPAPQGERFRPIQLTEPTGLVERWMKPQHVANQLYFVGAGNVRSDLLTQLAAHFRQTLGVDIEELPAVPFDRATVDDARSQVVAEELAAAIRRRYPLLARDARARIIGLTGDDMFLREMADSWTFGFSWRSDDGHMAVVSYARMDPVVFRLSPDPDMLRSRLTKMVAKDIGVIYYGLSPSSDPRSALYKNIGGTDELDVMTEYFEPQPTAPAQTGQSTRTAIQSAARGR